MHSPDVEHTLRNLLAIILAYTDILMQDAAPDDPNREHFIEIQNAAKAALQLVAPTDTPR